MSLLLPKVKIMSTSKEVKCETIPRDRTRHILKRLHRQVSRLVVWLCSGLMIPQVHFPMVTQDTALPIDKNLKVMNLPFCAIKYRV